MFSVIFHVPEPITDIHKNYSCDACHSFITDCSTENKKRKQEKIKRTNKEGKKTDGMCKQVYAFLNIISIPKLICDGLSKEHNEIK